MRWLLPLLLSGCVAVTPPVTSAEAFGAEHAGSYHLGPVDFSQSHFANSCAPYPAPVQQLAGAYLAGVDVSLNADGTLCDACALVTTQLGKSLLVRIITAGQSKSAGDMDLSPEAFDLLLGEDPMATPQNPRPMSWRLAKCPANGPMLLQFQTEANTDWTSFWVRNPRLPVSKVEVKSARHADFTALRRETDGTWNQDRGFGAGAFTLRVTSVNGDVVTQTFPGFSAGQLLETTIQFD